MTANIVGFVGGFLMSIAAFNLLTGNARFSHVLTGVLGFWLALAAVFL